MPVGMLPGKSSPTQADNIIRAGDMVISDASDFRDYVISDVKTDGPDVYPREDPNDPYEVYCPIDFHNYLLNASVDLIRIGETIRQYGDDLLCALDGEVLCSIDEKKRRILKDTMDIGVGIRLVQLEDIKLVYEKHLESPEGKEVEFLDFHLDSLEMAAEDVDRAIVGEPLFFDFLTKVVTNRQNHFEEYKNKDR